MVLDERFVWCRLGFRTPGCGLVTRGIAMRIKQSALKLLSLGFALIGVILMTSPGLHAGSVSTTSMTLTGVGDGASFGDVYVDPYTATVGSTANVSVICDDWSNNSYLNESWTAYVINASTVSNSALGTPMFGNSQSLYNELAWLGAQLLANPTDTNAQTEISFAMWDLSYGINGNNESPSPLAYMQEILGSGYATNSLYEGTENYINEALGLDGYAGESAYNSAGWQILTPESGTQNQGYGTPQEFMTYSPTGAPEPSQLGTLAADLLLLAVAVVVFRRSGLAVVRR
jgi:hypothetical protein